MMNHWTDDWAVLSGDMRERLRELPDDTFDACVCDPPRGVARRCLAARQEGFQALGIELEEPSVEGIRDRLGKIRATR